MSEKFHFVGNVACLDFVNTEVTGSEGRVDRLADIGDLVAWLGAAGLVGEAEAREARERWGGTREGREALDQARRFRAVLREMAERIAAGRGVGNAALDAINAVLGRPAHTIGVRRARGGFERVERWSFVEPADLLAPVAESACDLLVDGDLSLVRKCRNPDCILFFYDTTKNHARAWCSMSACGNRTKVAAHYRRHRAAKGRAH